MPRFRPENPQEHREAMREWRKVAKSINEECNTKQKKISDRMVNRHKAKNPPSTYKVGENVIVKIAKKGKKRETKKTKIEKVVSPYAYIVIVNGKRRRVPVSDITSETREIEKEKMKLARENVSEPDGDDVVDDGAEGMNRDGDGVGVGVDVGVKLPAKGRYTLRDRKKRVRSSNWLTDQEMEDAIVAINVQDDEVSVNDIRYEILRDHLLTYQLRPVETLKDGNCFFRAVSHMLHGDDREQMKIRQRAIERVSQREDDFKDMIVGNDVPAYVRGMSVQNTWADTPIVVATAEELNIQINIVSADTGMITSIAPRPLTVNPLTEEPPPPVNSIVTIGIVDDFHYCATEENIDFNFDHRTRTTRHQGESTGGTGEQSTTTTTTTTTTTNQHPDSADRAAFEAETNIQREGAYTRETNTNGNGDGGAGTKDFMKVCAYCTAIALICQCGLTNDVCNGVDTNSERKGMCTTSGPNTNDQVADTKTTTRSLRKHIKRRRSPTPLTVEQQSQDEDDHVDNSTSDFENKGGKKRKNTNSDTKHKKPRKKKQIDVITHLKQISHVELVSVDQLWEYKEQDRNLVPVPGKPKNALKKLTKLLIDEGLNYPITLAVSKTSGKAYVFEGNHRLAALRNTGSKWAPVYVSYYFLRDDFEPTFKYIPASYGQNMMEHDWPDYPTPSSLGFMAKQMNGEGSEEEQD